MMLFCVQREGAAHLRDRLPLRYWLTIQPQLRLAND